MIGSVSVRAPIMKNSYIFRKPRGIGRFSSLFQGLSGEERPALDNKWDAPLWVCEGKRGFARRAPTGQAEAFKDADCFSN
jgi:hypothetical protein